MILHQLALAALEDGASIGPLGTAGDLGIAAALITVVLAFLRFLSNTRKDVQEEQAKEREAFRQALQAIRDEHSSERALYRETLDKMAARIDRLIEQQQETNHHLGVLAEDVRKSRRT